VAFAITALLWRIYVHRAGQLLGEAIAAACDPVRVASSALLAHLVMIAGIIAIAVGDELVIEQPFGHTWPGSQYPMQPVPEDARPSPHCHPPSRTCHPHPETDLSRRSYRQAQLKKGATSLDGMWPLTWSG
jgi:Bacterial low temperature requirement A protein (LtrA)